MRWLLHILGWSRYQGFVARRYLMVPEQKVRLGVRVAIGAALAVLIPIIAFAGVAPDSPLLLLIERLAGAVLVATVVGGVLTYSRPAFIVFGIGAVLAAIGFVLSQLSEDHIRMLLFYDPPGVPPWFHIADLILLAFGGVLAFLALFFGVLRAFFTFFTTVPIGGVWIGTAALVCVLSVMSGFEADLREKILGSNAHILVTPEDGELTGWQDVKARIDKIPDVVASTPYAVSEVVIAANNNGMNVIIKGIDPKTVGQVTKLISSIQPLNASKADKEATMAALQPLVDDPHDLQVQQRAPVANPVDPPPADMPSSNGPIDFSEPGSDATGSGSAAIIPLPLPPIPMPGADAVVDPPPPDLVTSDAPPVDYSHAGSGHTGSGHAGSDDADPLLHLPIDATFDTPSMSRRTQSLPGVLVGAELVKQTHLYLGQEVRVVSPLSDPSNPDATGTPIPFNRDYRIAGIFFTGMYEYDLKYVYVTLDSFQEFLDRGDAVDGIEVRITDPDDTDQLVPRIKAVLGPAFRVQDWKELNQSLFSALKLEKIAMFLVLGIVILVASFSIVGNLIMVVVEKSREIALLKTLGASDAGVMQLFAIQGLLIGLIGTTLGVAFGLCACYIGKHFGIPLNPDVYYIDRMPVHVDASSVIVTFLAGVVISIAATFYPALLAAQVRPAAGMRH